MAEVTKRHRELAYTAARDLAVPPDNSPAERWIETGDGEPPGVWLRIAQALAGIETEALAAAPQPVKALTLDDVDHLESGCAEAFVNLQWRQKTGCELALHQVEWLREHERYMDRQSALARLSAAVKPKETP